MKNMEQMSRKDAFAVREIIVFLDEYKKLKKVHFHLKFPPFWWVFVFWNTVNLVYQLLPNQITFMEEKKMKKISCVVAAMLVVVLVLTGCGGTSSGSSVKKQESVNVSEKASEASEDQKEDAKAAESGKTESNPETDEEKGTSDEKKVEKEKKPEITEADFETKGYMRESIFGDCIYYLVVTNNASEAVNITASGIARDANGEMLAVDDMEILIIGAGQTSIGYFYFEECEGVETVDYTMKFKTDTSYTDVLANLSMEQVVKEKKVIVSVTNNGDITADFVEGYALFFDADGNVVGEESNYFTDDDSEIKPGDTILKEFECYDKFDSVEVYLTGRHSEW